MNYIHASLVISNQSIFVKYLVVHHYSKCTKCKLFFSIFPTSANNYFGRKEITND